jgi:CheY-like chemotaxis protein
MHSLLAGRRILIVEDEMLVALVLQDMLADLRCVVVGPSTTVDEALAQIEKQVPDAAVLDVNLNGQMSYPVADALLACHVPFVFSTGYSSNRLQDGYRTYPALQKPYHVMELGDALARVMGLAKSCEEDGPAPVTPGLAA